MDHNTTGTFLPKDLSLPQLRQRYLDDLPGKVGQIEALWKKLVHFNWNQDAFKLFYRLLHTQAGNAATFGLADLADIASNLERKVEQLISRQHYPEEAERHEIAALLTKLRQAALQPAGVWAGGEVIAKIEAQSVAKSQRRLLIYLVDDDPYQINYLSSQISQYGFEVVAFDNLQAMREAYLQKLPDAIISDIVFPEGDLAGIEAIAAIKRIQTEPATTVPIIFISARGDLTARLKALQAGSDAYLVKPINVSALIHKLKLLTATTEEPLRVMLVDDSAVAARYHGKILEAANMKTQVVKNPLHVMQSLLEFRPDLILMDLYMPECSGFDLARLVRQEEAFLNIPILFLSGETSKDKHFTAMRLGADDFLVKPVEAEKLVAVVAGRAQRARALSNQLSYLGRQDGVTGLFNRNYFMNALEQLLLETQLAAPAVLRLELDNSAMLENSFGVAGSHQILAGISKLITEQLAAGDIAARYTEHSFILFVQREQWDRVLSLAETLLQRVAQHPFTINKIAVNVSCSIGITAATTKTVANILAEAALASEEAAKKGGNRIHLHDRLADATAQSHQEKRYLEMINHSLNPFNTEKYLKLTFQPIANTLGDSRDRYEVFLRMVNESQEEIPVPEFITAARRHQLMSKLDRWVLEQCCLAVAKRQKNLKIADNRTFFIKVSLESLLDSGFHQWLADYLRGCTLNGQHLSLELRENEALDNLPRFQQFVAQFQALGCQIALENFGKNPTAFQLLKNIPVHYVKLDRTLVHNLPTEPEQQQTVAKLIAQAHERDIKVIASYVEDAGSLNLLWRYGIDLIQGHFIQQPDEQMTFFEGSN